MKLTSRERDVLAVLADFERSLVLTPRMIAGQLQARSEGRPQAWQGVTRTMAALVRHGLATRRSHPKMTCYEITPDGCAALRRCPVCRGAIHWNAKAGGFMHDGEALLSCVLVMAREQTEMIPREES